MRPLCLRCKGRGWCGESCKWNKVKYEEVDFKKDFQGSSPTVFIGRSNYPKVSIGVMSPQVTTPNARSWDDPILWSKNYSINDVINKRRTLVNCNNEVNDRFLRKVQEVALARDPVSVEASLSKKPKPSLDYDFKSNPMGPSSSVRRLDLCTNPSIPNRVEKYYYDFDLKSTKAVVKLYEHGYDENTITRMFSTGAFGVKKDRKVVPTRWSITAVDDTLGKSLIQDVKGYDVISNYRVLTGDFYGNYYTIILLPWVWGYELFETINGAEYCHDFEDYHGRSEYAHETAGGYYASRLGVLEYLKKIKKQATAIVLRQVTSEYYCPLGVWVVRQATRKATEGVNCFNSKELMLEHVRRVTPVHELLHDSVLFERFNSQKSLMNYL